MYGGAWVGQFGVQRYKGIWTSVISVMLSFGVSSGSLITYLVGNQTYVFYIIIYINNLVAYWILYKWGLFNFKCLYFCNSSKYIFLKQINSHSN